MNDVLGRKSIICFDVDDTLNNLSEYVHRAVGADSSKQDNFNFSRCTHIDEFQRRQILQLFGTPSVWYKLSWVEGAKDIGKFNTNMSEVFIHSNNFNQRVADVKTLAIMRDIPHVARDHINMEVLDATSPEKKKPFPGTTIIVEDNFASICLYTDAAMRLLIDKPYNRAEDYGTTDEQNGITRVSSLLQANQYIADYLTKLYGAFIPDIGGTEHGSCGTGT